MWWMLSREVLRLRGTISREQKWDVVVDLYFYRDPEEAEKDEAAAKEILPAPKMDVVQDAEPIEDAVNWGDDTPAVPSAAVISTDNWDEEEPAAASAGVASAGVAVPPTSSWGGSGAF